MFSRLTREEGGAERGTAELGSNTLLRVRYDGGMTSIGPGSAPSPSTLERVRKWGAALDGMDYFQILRIDRTALPEQVDLDVLKKAFAVFAASFHPDRFQTADEDTRAQATNIFRRGNEAYRVLTNPALRAKYLVGLARGEKRISPDEIARQSSSSFRMAVAAKVPIDEAPTPAVPCTSLVTSAAATSFAKEADALIARGDFKKALLQLQLALSKEPKNAALLVRVREMSMKAGSSGMMKAVKP